MSDATTPVILSAVRTPIGRYLGGLAGFTAPQLGAMVIREAVSRAGVDPAAVEEVIMGQVVQGGSGQAPARQALIHAGLPAAIPALTINKVCGSGLKAVMLASQAIKAGDVKYDETHGTVELHVNEANVVEVLRMLSSQSQKNIIASSVLGL